jgi:putative methyltransferase
MSRLYLEAAGVLERILFQKLGLKDALYKSRCPSKQKPAILGLVSKAVANHKLLNDALKKIGAFDQEEKMRTGLMFVMATELLMGSGEIRGGGKVRRYLVGNLEKLKDFVSKGGREISLPSVTSKPLPRYIRVNARRWKSLDAAVANLKSMGVSEVQVDKDIPNLLVVDSKETKLIVCQDAVKRGDYILQDKSTCISAFSLVGNIDRESSPVHVIDACSAPGGKALHILELLRPGDSLTAVEQDPKRAKVLEERLNALGDVKKGVKVQVITCDFLTLFQDDPRLAVYSPVTHVNLDPSCSGTGMDGPATRGKERLRTLASFQSKMLKHALNAFDTVRTVCYSTCSVLSVENEDVVNQVVSDSSKFEVDTDPLPPSVWSSKQGEDGFVRTSPENDFCRGFFLAKLVLS